MRAIMKYIVKMRNPKTGKVEAYDTEADNREDLQQGLDFWERDAGYTIISVEPMTIHLYRISADGGTSWTEQWLTSQEATNESEEYLVEPIIRGQMPII